MALSGALARAVTRGRLRLLRVCSRNILCRLVGKARRVALRCRALWSRSSNRLGLAVALTMVRVRLLQSLRKGPRTLRPC